MKYVLSLLLLVCVHVQAGDLLLGQLSHHFDRCNTWDCPYLTEVEVDYADRDGCRENGCTIVYGDYREKHPLIGYTNGKYTGFIMKNSYDKVSAVVLRNYSMDLGPYLRPAVSIGIATGYDSIYSNANVGPFNPAGLFSLDIHPKSDDYGLIISWLPEQWISAGIRIKLN